ncbi:hypothetical protein E2C01_029011 [Portunus trituberculatus]|uniref:Uncharacterized protein n=1 Tax=Portunus trituberculatus TaxID=210409 RepID=A0A5B7EQU0_PORTR|nr:hypothetical protein [Portunus trituberculatus]
MTTYDVSKIEKSNSTAVVHLSLQPPCFQETACSTGTSGVTPQGICCSSVGNNERQKSRDLWNIPKRSIEDVKKNGSLK